MPSQTESQCQKIKERVRDRDFTECVVCSIGEAEHRKRYGKTLDVHRIVPGSLYSSKPGVCVTMCELCHDAMHYKGNWHWVLLSECDFDWTRESNLKRAIRNDVNDERAWRRRAAWGARLMAYRLERNFRTTEGLAIHTGLQMKDIEAFEDGRREPSLFELKALARELKVKLDVLAEEEEVPESSWLSECERRANLRAITFCAREQEEEEMLYSDHAHYIRKVVREEYALRARQKAQDVEYRSQLGLEVRKSFFEKKSEEAE